MLDPASTQRIAECGKELAAACVPSMTSGGSVHIPTLIAACARMAGSYLLRSLDVERSCVAPGQAILSIQATEKAPILLRTCAAILQSLGTVIASAPTGPLDSETHKPKQDFLESQRTLEPVFAPLQVKHGLNDEQMARAVAVAAGIVIHSFGKHLEPNVGFGIAAVGFAEGLQTSPAQLGPGSRLA